MKLVSRINLHLSLFYIKIAKLLDVKYFFHKMCLNLK